ncbi:type II toxin-antitoxin system HigB family toxin [Nibrella saemangeumensis]|uniref:Type II toxin-antitoxin system HigB family toxin n=1 Tax=Nibrella saemangeumensis TaxID=1084526 RepID=A0ABP8MAW0_9BACT
MRVISKKALHLFAVSNAQANDALNEWYLKTTATYWHSFSDIKQTFNSVDYVGNDRYVFNVKGNQYRIVAMIHFRIHMVYIRFVGTHAEYDKIDASTI